MGERLAHSWAGIKALAAYFSEFPEYAIHRRFSTLTEECLCYHEAELTELEEQWHRLELIDDQPLEGDESRANTSSAGLSEERKRKLQEWSDKLQTYLALLTASNAVTSIPNPESFDLKWFQKRLDYDNRDGDSAMYTACRELYGVLDDPESCKKDLAITVRRPESSSFQKWLTQKFFTWLHLRIYDRYGLKRLVELLPGTEGYVYQGHLFSRVANAISSAVASLLLIGQIAILYAVESTRTRLIIIACFCVLFTACMSFFTDSKQRDVFIAVTT
ncbi:MAG: hypothetical protein M1820_006421 [Bogoriella megaspora]|nr:MAG: hypothetical protein M1820_006421 [Bogoriella megaspora]